MVHLFIIKLDSKEIDGVPVTGIPVVSGIVLYMASMLNAVFSDLDFILPSFKVE